VRDFIAMPDFVLLIVVSLVPIAALVLARAAEAGEKPDRRQER